MGRVEAEGNTNTTNTMRDNTPRPETEAAKIIKPKNEAELKTLISEADGKGRSFFGITRKGDRVVLEMDSTTANVLCMSMGMAHTLLCHHDDCPLNQITKKHVEGMSDAILKEFLHGIDGMSSALARVLGGQKPPISEN